MSKKKKKGKKDLKATADKASDAEVSDEPSNGASHDEHAEAAAELAADTPTRFRPASLDDPEAAIAELAQSSPTRAGEALDEAADAAAELAEEAQTGIHALPKLVPSSEGDDSETVRVERVDDHHRFDFGSDPATQGLTPSPANPDEPPDPGSADAASPRLQSIVESVLFASDRPMSLRQLADLVEETEVERIRSAVLAVEQGWRDRGVQLHEVAGGYQFRTHPANAGWVQRLLQQKPIRLSRALLETLAIVSYRQPITRPEIDDIRGVDSGGTLKTLMDRALIRILGKKEEPGRPLLYGTTKEFLEFFSLRDLKDLPTLREYHELSEEHRAQVAALEGAAPAGTFVAEGEPEPEAEGPELPKLARLEISAPKEDAAELEEIDRLIRTAGATISTDSDLPTSDPNLDVVLADAVAGNLEPDDLVVTGRFEARPRLAEIQTSAPPLASNDAASEDGEAVLEFEEERERTGTFGDPLPVVVSSGDFEEGEATRVRGGDLDESLVDGRDPEKEPAA